MSEKIDYVHLLKHIKEEINLKDYLETDAGCDFSRNSSEEMGQCNCPLPAHKDQNASFFVNRMSDGVWVFHCFGCGERGTLIDFFKNYYDIGFNEAMRRICEHFKIQNSQDIILNGIINSEKKCDVPRKLQNLNIISSNQCRILLQKDFHKNIDWVKGAYKRLNLALEQEDELEIENVGNQAFERMLENEF